MLQNTIETHLVKKQSTSPKICTRCNTKVLPGELYHLEKGVKEHLHSLLARKFCSDCYAKYGEISLLKGNE